MNDRAFVDIDPKILYFGTPVAIVSSLNGDGTTNLAPISSFWALGWTFVLGLLDETQTCDNLAQHRECVINLPSPDMWPQIEKLAPLTAKDPVPELKKNQFHSEKKKFQAAGLSTMSSERVQPLSVAECPVHLEGRVSNLHRLGGEKLNALGGGVAAEVEIVRVRVEREYVLRDHYIDPAKWSPLIYNFRHYYRLADSELGKTFRSET